MGRVVESLEAGRRVRDGWRNTARSSWPCCNNHKEVPIKRAGNLMAEIASLENLRVAFWKAARAEVVAYRARLETNLAALRDGLPAGAVAGGYYHCFTLHDPKDRRLARQISASG